MFKILVFISFLFSVSIYGKENVVELKKYLWKNRILLVFDSSEESKLWEKQKAFFVAEESENAERDLLLFRINRKDLNAILDKAEQGSYAALLIGKDGGVKAIYPKPIPLTKIYKRIDSMPMRQQEMKE